MPIPILQATPRQLSALVDRACPAPEGAALVLFPALAETVHDYPSYAEALRGCDLLDEPIRGVALVGPDRWVRSLTGSLPLLR